DSAPMRRRPARRLHAGSCDGPRRRPHRGARKTPGFGIVRSRSSVHARLSRLWREPTALDLPARGAHPMDRTRQTPLHSGHGPRPTAREVIGDRSLDGAIAIVTGGYAGIGLETTRALAGAGATVIVPARTPEKARAALDGMERVELDHLDLSDPASID